MLSGQLIKDYWEYNVNLVRNAGYALADSVPGQYVYYDFAYGIGEISWKEKIEGHISVIQDTWDALADEATYVCSSPNRTQSFTYGAICELPLSFIKPVTGLIETFDAAYEGEDTATQAIENVYASYDQKMMDAAAFPVDERAYNDGKVPADIAGGIMMGILLDQLTSGMSFFSASPVDELADCALSTTRSELAGSAEGAGEVAQIPQKVIGHYPEYVEMSNYIDVKPFSIPDSIWSKMTPSEQWAANQTFLDRAISRGSEFILATPIDQVRPGSFLQKEIEYLISQGYELSSDGTKLMK